MEEGQFRSRAAHLLFDGVGRLVEMSVVGGVELQWRGRTVWRAARGPEDAHLVLLPESVGQYR